MRSLDPAQASTTAKTRSRLRPVVWLLLFALLLALLWLLWRFPPSQFIDNAAIANNIAALGWLAVPAFLLLGALATSVGLPRQMFAFIGGYSFGVLQGVLWGSLAAIAGCALCFYCARRFFRAPVTRRFSAAVGMLNGFVNDDAFLKIIVLRLQPLGTNLMTNLAAGVSMLSARVFLTSSLLGYIPQMLVFALLGSGIRVHSNTQLLVSVLLFIVSVLIGIYLYRRHRMRLPR